MYIFRHFAFFVHTNSDHEILIVCIGHENLIHNVEFACRVMFVVIKFYFVGTVATLIHLGLVFKDKCVCNS